MSILCNYLGPKIFNWSRKFRIRPGRLGFGRTRRRAQRPPIPPPSLHPCRSLHELPCALRSVPTPADSPLSQRSTPLTVPTSQNSRPLSITVPVRTRFSLPRVSFSYYLSNRDICALEKDQVFSPPIVKHTSHIDFVKATMSLSPPVRLYLSALSPTVI